MHSCFLTTAAALALSVGASAIAIRGSSSACTAFANSLKLSSYNTTVLNSTYYAAGTYASAVGTNNINFCQIFAAVAYGSPGDQMVFATWLPDAVNYTGRFLAVGNGGFAGDIDNAGMMANLNSGLGFVVAGGDGGHDSGATGTVGAPGEYIAFLHDSAATQAWIHNGISLFTGPAKAMATAMYSKKISHSYYDGCSTGGAQGYALAQYHPNLFNGIIASSPGNYYSHLALSFLYNSQQTSSVETYITPSQLVGMTAAVVEACDEDDGVQDGVIGNPSTCQFESTPLDLNAAKAIYAGAVRADNGAQLYPGFAFGSESSWTLQEGPLADTVSTPLLQNLVYNNLNYDASTFDFASDLTIYTAKTSPFIDEISTNLNSFHSLGGKLLSFQGWADQLNSPYWPIQHLSQIESAYGGNVSSWYELFMVPGAGHCGSNPLYPNTPGTYLSVPALVAWVEKGVRPTQIESTSPIDQTNTTRKLCPWPQNAYYVGGDSSSWTSFVCK